MHKNADLGDTVYFWFGSNDTSGSGDDGASAAADVRLAGAAAGAAPVLSPTPTLLSSASFPDGCYEVAVAATSGNGFAAGNEYAVFCTLAVDSQNPTGFIGCFTLDRQQVDVREISGDETAADNLESACDNYSATRGLTGTALPAAAADAAGGLVISDAGGLDIDNELVNAASYAQANFDMITDMVEDDGGIVRFTANALEEAPTGGSAPTAAAIRAEIDSNSTQLAAIVADTNELQSDLANGGRLDLLIDAIKAVTDNLPNSGALTDLATAASIAALNDPTAQAVVDELMAEVLESGKTYLQAMLDMWAVLVGDSAADDGDTPTSITYDSPDGSVQRTHALSSTARTVS